MVLYVLSSQTHVSTLCIACLLFTHILPYFCHYTPLPCSPSPEKQKQLALENINMIAWKPLTWPTQKRKLHLFAKGENPIYLILKYMSCLKSSKQYVNKISYIATFSLVRNSLNSTVVFYNFEISLSSASTTIYLFVKLLFSQDNHILRYMNLFSQTHVSSTSVLWLPLTCYFFLNKTTSVRQKTHC